MSDPERILEVASEAFTRSGTNASLDDIARQADGGPGAWYCHFPMRDTFLQAVDQTEVDHSVKAMAKGTHRARVTHNLSFCSESSWNVGLG